MQLNPKSGQIYLRWYSYILNIIVICYWCVESIVWNSNSLFNLYASVLEPKLIFRCGCLIRLVPSSVFPYSKVPEFLGMWVFPLLAFLFAPSMYPKVRMRRRLPLWPWLDFNSTENLAKHQRREKNSFGTIGIDWPMLRWHAQKWHTRNIDVF